MPPSPSPIKPLTYASALHAWLQAARDTVQRHGVDAEALLQQVGLDLSAEHDPMARHPAHLGLAFWQQAMAATGEELLGMEVALQSLPISFNALGYALMASENLGQMYLRLARFAHVVSDAADVRFDVREGSGCLTLNGDTALLSSVDDRTRWSIFDYALLTVVRGSRMLYGRSFMPLEIRLQRQRPDKHKLFEKVLRCVPIYGCQDNAMVVDATTLQQPLSYANMVVAQASDDALERYSTTWAGQASVGQLQAQLALELKALLPSGEPRQEEVAARLNLSLRSLQRRLAEAGSSYRQVLNDTRHQLALAHLSSDDLSVGEIAFLLGFSEVSGFTRAFRRWTGLSPRAWRQHAMPGRRTDEAG